MAESAFEVINLAVSKYDIKELQKRSSNLSVHISRKDIPHKY